MANTEKNTKVKEFTGNPKYDLVKIPNYNQFTVENALNSMAGYALGSHIKNKRLYGDVDKLYKAVGFIPNDGLVIFKDNGTINPTPIKIEQAADGSIRVANDVDNIKKGTNVFDLLKDKNNKIYTDTKNILVKNPAYQINRDSRLFKILDKTIPGIVPKEAGTLEKIALNGLHLPKPEVHPDSGIFKRALVKYGNTPILDSTLKNADAYLSSKIPGTTSIVKNVWKGAGPQLLLALGDLGYRNWQLNKANDINNDTYADWRNLHQDRLDGTGKSGNIDSDADFVSLSDLGNEDTSWFGRIGKAATQFMDHPLNSFQTYYKSGRLFGIGKQTPEEQEAQRQLEAFQGNKILADSTVNQDRSPDGSLNQRYGTLGNLSQSTDGSDILFNYSTKNRDIDDIISLGKQIQDLNTGLKFGHFDNGTQRFIWDKAAEGKLNSNDEVLSHLTNKYGKSFIDYLDYQKRIGNIDQETYDNVIKYGLHHDKRAGTVRDYLGNGDTVIQGAAILPSGEALRQFSDFNPDAIQSAINLNYSKVDPTHADYDLF